MLDIRDDRTTAIRSSLIDILTTRIRGDNPLSPPSRRSSDKPPSLPPIGGDVNKTPNAPSTEVNLVAEPGRSLTGPQLPPLRFGRATSPPQHEQKKLTPITESSNSGYTNGRNSMGASGSFGAAAFSGQEPSSPPVPEKEKSILDGPLSTSPPPLRSPHLPEDQPARPPSSSGKIVNPTLRRSSEDSSRSDLNQSGSIRPRESIGNVSVNAPSVSAPSIRPSQSSASDTRTTHSETRPKSPSISILTSPHSVDLHVSDRSSILTSPYSPRLANAVAESAGGLIAPRFWGTPNVPQLPEQLPVAQHPNTQPSSPQTQESDSIFGDAASGALFYMQQFGSGNSTDHSRVPTTIAEQDDESSAYSHSSPTTYPSPSSGSKSPPLRPMPFVDQASTSAVSAINLPTPADRVSLTSRSGLGRKPSGAREQAMRSFNNSEGISSSQPVTEEEEGSQSEDQVDSKQHQTDQPQVHRSMSSEDPNLDVLAALSYLDGSPTSPTTTKVGPLNVPKKVPSPPPVPPTIQEPEPQYKSSFAPSKQAAERKAKVQAQQAAHHAATHKPGRANGNKRKSRIAGTWDESSDEEEEEEEEDDDDDDVDSDTDPSLANKPTPPAPASLNASQRSVQGHVQPGGSNTDGVYPHVRPPRTLPQPPGNQNYRKFRIYSSSFAV